MAAFSVAVGGGHAKEIPYKVPVARFAERPLHP